MAVPFPIISDAINRPHLSDESPWRVRFRKIYEGLRTNITLFINPPGTRLDVSLIATQYGVSKTPIRTVFHRLENEGLVITQHGVGTTVTEIDYSKVRQAMELRMHLAEVIGDLDPCPPNDTISQKLELLLLEFKSLEKETSSIDFAILDMHLHNCKCELIEMICFVERTTNCTIEQPAFGFTSFQKLDLKSEFSALQRDYQQTLKAVMRGDVKAVGFITRNSLSEELYRINDLID